jgi:hypothetical protein
MLANLIILLSIAVPLTVAVIVVFGLRRWKAREGRRLPINAKLMHGPGEQLRQQISDTEDSLSSALAILVVMGPFLVAFWALSRIELSKATLGPVGWVALLFWIVITLWQTREIVGLGRKRRRLLEGLIAEQFTAQELNRLVGAGCTVFHDVPGDGFNIDHVVISPSAVFAIETKSRRKPKQDPKGGHYKVGFDGEKLQFPDHRTASPLDQARRQAEWLSKYISKAIARPVLVTPALALPGWWIEYGKSAASSTVKVFNPAGNGGKFMAGPGSARLDEGTRALIAQSMVLRYPETPASLVFKEA